MYVRLAGGYERPPEDIQAVTSKNTTIYNVVTCRLTTYIRDVSDISYGFKADNFEAIHRTYVTV